MGQVTGVAIDSGDTQNSMIVTTPVSGGGRDVVSHLLVAVGDKILLTLLIQQSIDLSYCDIACVTPVVLFRTCHVYIVHIFLLVSCVGAQDHPTEPWFAHPPSHPFRSLYPGRGCLRRILGAGSRFGGFGYFRCGRHLCSVFILCFRILFIFSFWRPLERSRCNRTLLISVGYTL